MIRVFVDNFTHPNKIRAQEIDKCIALNKSNTNFSYSLLKNSFGKRMTYQDMINYINRVTFNFDINVIANIDITFDETIQLLNNIQKNQFVSLTRYELSDDGSLHFEETNAKYSQDVWAWRGKCRISNANFCLGVWGCDNRLAYEALQAGYDVINPSYSIFTYHNHSSNIRSDNYKMEIVPGPQYFVYPMTWK